MLMCCYIILSYPMIKMPQLVVIQTYTLCIEKMGYSITFIKQKILRLYKALKIVFYIILYIIYI